MHDDDAANMADAAADLELGLVGNIGSLSNALILIYDVHLGTCKEDSLFSRGSHYSQKRLMPRYRQLREIPLKAADATLTQRILRDHGTTVSPLIRWLLRRK